MTCASAFIYLCGLTRAVSAALVRSSYLIRTEVVQPWRGITAIGAPLIPYRSLFWVMSEVSEVWETGRNSSRASLPESAL